MNSIEKQPDELGGLHMRGHLKIHDPESGEVFHNKANAIHYENIAEAIAYCLSGLPGNFIQSMNFGNGGTNIDPTGVITYLPTNAGNQNAALYNQTFSKIIDALSPTNLDPVNNKMEVRHIPGKVFSDILVTCLLDFGEPNGQAAFDNSQSLNDAYVFDELGIFSSAGKMLTHVVFHPTQKALNRKIQVDYTIRIQALTSLTYIG